MKKKIIIRALGGAPIGLAISTMITIFVSAGIGDGNYYPVVPALAASCGSQINAVMVQAFFALLYGAVWGGASVLFEIESWSRLRQTATHFLTCSIATCPIAFCMYWMPHNAAGIITYFTLFLGIYLFIWFLCYFVMKRQVRKMDEKMKEWGRK